MTTRALVLGGGGPVGVGWLAGMAKGLAENGIHLAEADLIVGTSAGSIIGAKLALGTSPAALFDEQLSSVDRVEGAPDASLDIEAMTEIGKLWVGGAAVTQPVRAEIGVLAAKARTRPEADWIASFEQIFGSADWPARPLVVTGVDIQSGAFVSWNQASGIPLPVAIAASCSVPGILPPVAIDGSRFMDGGLRSVSNADLAEGYDRIVVLAPSGSADTPYDANTRGQLHAEVAALRANGSLVEAVLPDAEALADCGPNRMDFTALKPAAHAGLAQASRVAGSIRAVWQP